MSRVSRLIFLFVFAAAGSSFTVAAFAAEEVSLDPNYNSDVWFNLDKGVVAKHAANDWDIAFQVNGIAGGLISNEAAGVQVFHVPNSTADTWAETIDTSDMRSSWTSWYNGPDSWHNGAFNLDVDYNTGSYGWGSYNPANHSVSGIAVYVVIDRQGQARKFVVDKLSGGVLTFKYADLDGSNEHSGSIDKAAFNGRMFGYYDMVTHTTVDREPDFESWDLYLGRYIEMLGPNRDIPYPVVGVQSNSGVSVAIVNNATPVGDLKDIQAPQAETFTDYKRAIGSDWKMFDGSEYVIENQRVYFVKRADESIYRLVFREFGGSASGNIEFDIYPPLTTTSVEEVQNHSMLLYPNVVGQGTQSRLAYAAFDASAQLFVYDLQGRIMQSQTLRNAAGLQTVAIETETLSAGSYIIELRQGEQRSQRRLVVQ